MWSAVKRDSFVVRHSAFGVPFFCEKSYREMEGKRVKKSFGEIVSGNDKNRAFFLYRKAESVVY